MAQWTHVWGISIITITSITCGWYKCLPNEKHKADRRQLQVSQPMNETSNWKHLRVSVLLELLRISPAPAGYLSDMKRGTCDGGRPRPASECKRLFGGVGQGAGAGQRMAGFLMWNLIEMCRSKLFSRTAGWLSSQPNDCSPPHPPPLPHGCPLLFIFPPSIWCELWSMKPQLNATEDKKKRSF